MSEALPISFRESWKSARRQDKILLAICVVLFGFDFSMLFIFPNDRAGFLRNVAMAQVLIVNQLTRMFLSLSQQKRILIAQLLFFSVMVVYMFAPVVGLVHVKGGTMPWDLLLISFVPLVLFMLYVRRTTTP